MVRQLNAEIISVGTELLLGHVTNTDAKDVSVALSEIGINVLYHSVVGDNPDRLAGCLNTAKTRSNLIICTGGLGPTCDDLTKQTICASFDIPLELNQDEFKNLYDYISSRHVYTENNTQQAFLPENCTVFHNTCGTAPGCAFEKDGIIVAMLPGPPKECREMIRLSLIPYLEQFSDDYIVSHTVNIFGLSESKIDSMFSARMNAMTNPSMAPYAKEADCFLKITAKAKSKSEAEDLCSPIINEVVSEIGDYVFGIDVNSLDDAVYKLLNKACKTMSLGQKYAISEEFSLEKIAKDMAISVKDSSFSDFGISIAGDESGHFAVALSTDTGIFVKRVTSGMPRPFDYQRRYALNHAYDMLRRYLEGKKVND